MALPKILTNYTAFVDGVGYAGRVDELTLPKLVLKTEEYAGGGLAAPVDIDMGMVEKMEAEASFAEINPALVALFGKPDTPVVFRGTLGPAAEPVAVTMTALIREIDPGSFKAGENAQLKLAMTASYLKIEINGQTTVEIDPVNMTRIVGGVDQLAAQREALNVN